MCIIESVGYYKGVPQQHTKESNNGRKEKFFKSKPEVTGRE